jgi:hypothetical protein
VATSSSAKKVAKLASRGKGKKVRFQSGTTFPAIVAIVSVLMLVLIGYARASMPGIEAGPPQPGDAWSIAYGIRICDEQLPNLTGTAAELAKDASTGDQTKVQTGNNADGIIHYHPQVGGATGRKARLGVFLDIYDVKLTETTLELPESQVGPGETRKWDTADFKCNGKDTQIRVRVWKDYTSNEFVDNVTNFRNLRFTNNGMVFAIAVVPKDADIPKPDSAATLTELGVIGGSSATTVPTGDTTPTGSTTPTSDTATGDTAAATTTVAASTTTGG